MHIVTGGAGFIGSAMVWMLNRMGIRDIWIVDDLADGTKWKNLPGLQFNELLGVKEFIENIEMDGALPEGTEAIIHLGACSATTERDADYLRNNNYEYSRVLAEHAIDAGVRFIAASSGSVYGAGECGYSDSHENLWQLRPLNMYGYSKLLFDQWAERSGAIKNLASLRFFNVYGPNEYHKGDMMSMVAKSYRLAAKGEAVKLFRSHRPDYGDGEQARDFVYVKDVIEVMWWLLEKPNVNGVFNIGAGEEATWNRLARAVFAALGREPRIEYVDMPDTIRGQYQYHTRADISRLRAAGYDGTFRTVEDGVRDYVVNHLERDNPHINNGFGVGAPDSE